MNQHATWATSPNCAATLRWNPRRTNTNTNTPVRMTALRQLQEQPYIGGTYNTRGHHRIRKEHTTTNEGQRRLTEVKQLFESVLQGSV